MKIKLMKIKFFSLKIIYFPWFTNKISNNQGGGMIFNYVIKGFVWYELYSPKIDPFYANYQNVVKGVF